MDIRPVKSMGMINSPFFSIKDALSLLFKKNKRVPFSTQRAFRQVFFRPSIFFPSAHHATGFALSVRFFFPRAAACDAPPVSFLSRLP
jgi:hypothetical protein